MITTHIQEKEAILTITEINKTFYTLTILFENEKPIPRSFYTKKSLDLYLKTFLKLSKEEIKELYKTKIEIKQKLKEAKKIIKH